MHFELLVRLLALGNKSSFVSLFTRVYKQCEKNKPLEGQAQQDVTGEFVAPDMLVLLI